MTNTRILTLSLLALFGCAADDVNTLGNDLSDRREENEPGGDDGSCPLRQVREVHTYIVAESGEVVKDSYQFCTQCLGEDGAPLGEEECTEQPTTPPEDPYACEWVDRLPDDPSGQSCWICKDPATGEVYQGCDLHACAEDGSCPNEGETCNADTGLCEYVWVDPCQPVESLPGDPTGFDCYSCTEAGEDLGSWCSGHTCEADADCEPFGLTCQEGLCSWTGDDNGEQCRPIESLPDDPTGSDCYECYDPSGMSYAFCKTHEG
jgi:hypothetical protein